MSLYGNKSHQATLYIEKNLQDLKQNEFETVVLKGVNLTRDFRVKVFFHESVSLGPLSIPLGQLQFYENLQRYSQLCVY